MPSNQDEHSKHKNRAKALRVLRTRLYQSPQEEQQNSIASARKNYGAMGSQRKDPHI